MKGLLLITYTILIVNIAHTQTPWTTSGSNIYYSGGNVGIGTSSPFSEFHVATNVDALSWALTVNNIRNNPTVSNYGIGLKLKHSNNSENNKWGGIASVQESSWANSSGLALFANETEYMRIKHNGYVGIGTTNPQAKLEISTANWISSLITLKDTHYSPDQVYNFQIESDGLKIKQDATINYQFKSGGDFVVNNGKVGIGIYDPGSDLHVYTTNPGDNSIKSLSILSHQNSSSNTNSGIAIELGRNENGNGHQPMAKVGYVQVNPGSWKGDLVFHTRTDVSTVSEKMRINSDGDIGIGTTTPSEKLEVNGTIRSKEVKVEASPWPDYVFADDYQLTTLEEIEAFIQSNNHLPEIPSAKEIETNGLEVGKMNALLLKKIEELTLYAIEQDKKNEELRIGYEALLGRIENLEKNKK